MSDTYVFVPSWYLWEAVAKHQSEILGKKSLDDLRDTYELYKDQSVINISKKSLTFAYKEWAIKNGHTVISVEQYFADYGEHNIKIGSYEVKNFTKEGFYVGCQFVSWEVFDKIAEKRPK